MKNLTSIFAAAVAVIILTTSVQNSFAKDALEVTDLSAVKNITSIKISGNVEVQLSQSATEGVTVFDNYYREYALVQVENGQLRISSFAPEKLKVIIDVKTLSAIEANGNVTISTLNQINTPELSIELEDSASAVINASSNSIVTVTDDLSKLTLSGIAKTYNMEISGNGKVDATHFEATAKIVKITEEGRAVTSTDGKTVILQAPAALAFAEEAN